MFGKAVALNNFIYQSLLSVNAAKRKIREA
jgi:hypothetical protein